MIVTKETGAIAEEYKRLDWYSQLFRFAEDKGAFAEVVSNVWATGKTVKRRKSLER